MYGTELTGISSSTPGLSKASRWTRVASAHDPIGGSMEHFINTANIKNYRQQLSDPAVDQDPVRRVMLVRLLAGELAKDADSKPTAQVADHREADLLARRQELSGVEYWAEMHRSAK
jgi:hypothetical protein